MPKPFVVAVYSTIIFALACIIAPLLLFFTFRDWQASFRPDQTQVGTIVKLHYSYLLRNFGVSPSYTLEIEQTVAGKWQVRQYNITSNVFYYITGEFKLTPDPVLGGTLTPPPNKVKLQVWSDDSLHSIEVTSPDHTPTQFNKAKNIAFYRVKEISGLFFAIVGFALMGWFGRRAWQAYDDEGEAAVEFTGYIVHFDLIEILTLKGRFGLQRLTVARIRFLDLAALEDWQSGRTTKPPQALYLNLDPAWLGKLEQGSLTTITLSRRLHYVYNVTHHTETVFQTEAGMRNEAAYQNFQEAIYRDLF